MQHASPLNQTADPGLEKILRGNRRYKNLIAKSYHIRRPFIEKKISSCVMKLRDGETKLLLNYYMVDKALVGASVELLFDGTFTIGKQYLWILRIYLQTLLDQTERFRKMSAAV